MVAKLSACQAALKAASKNVVIVDGGRPRGALVKALRRREDVGDDGLERLEG